MQTNEPVSNPNQQTSGPQPTNAPIPQQQPSDVSPPAQESIQGKKSNKWLIVGLGVLALVVLGTAGIFAYQNYQLKKQVEKPSPGPEVIPTKVPQLTPTNTISVPSPTPTADPTANWKEYINTKYDYQFKYPPRWSFKTTLTNETTSPLYVIRETIEGGETNNYLFLVSTWDNPSGLSLRDWLQFMKNSNALTLPAEDIMLTSNYTVANQPAFRIWNDPISKGEKPGKCVQACPILDVYLVYKNRAYRAQLNYMREVDEESQIIFGQVLSAFKFTN